MCHVTVLWNAYLFGPKWSINYYYYYYSVTKCAFRTYSLYKEINQVICNSGRKLVIIAWTGDELSRGQTSSSEWGKIWLTNWHTEAGSDNYANPVYGVATICHQVRWLRWGHPSLFHTAITLLIWYKMFCVRDISYRLIWMEFMNMFSVYAQSGTHSRFNW